MRSSQATVDSQRPLNWSRGEYLSDAVWGYSQGGNLGLPPLGQATLGISAKLSGLAKGCRLTGIPLAAQLAKRSLWFNVA